jgi:conjugative relaxase-like TrwC/TraI family protein
VTVRILSYRGDGSYFLRDQAHELDGLRVGPPGVVLAGGRGRTVDETVGALLARPLRSGRRGFDVIIAAPKEVSVLLAIEPADGGRRVVALHAEAMSGALEYLREEGLRTRAPTGQRVCAPSEPVIVEFTHGANRTLDPHLHSHLLIGGRDAFGDPLDARRLYRHAAAADALYRAALRAGLPDAVDRLSWTGRTGAMRVEGIDPGLVAAMSVARGRDGRVERTGGKAQPSRREVTDHWRGLVSRAERFEPPFVPDRSRFLIDEHRFGAELGDGIVSRTDVTRAWAQASTFGLARGSAGEASRIVMRGWSDEDGIPAVTLRRARAVRVLGARPTEVGALAMWVERAVDLDRYLQAGHPIEWAIDPRGATPAARIALAPLGRRSTASRSTGIEIDPIARGAHRGRFIG